MVAMLFLTNIISIQSLISITLTINPIVDECMHTALTVKTRGKRFQQRELLIFIRVSSQPEC